MYFDYTHWRNDSAELRRRINNLSWDTKRDMLRMFDLLEHKIMAIMREEIECKRRGIQTERHKKLVNDFNELRENFVQHATYAQLMG